MLLLSFSIVECSVLDWGEKPLTTLALVSSCLFIVAPIFHALLWAISLIGRKYVNTNNEDCADIDEEAAVA